MVWTMGASQIVSRHSWLDVSLPRPGRTMAIKVATADVAPVHAGVATRELRSVSIRLRDLGVECGRPELSAWLFSGDGGCVEHGVCHRDIGRLRSEMAAAGSRRQWLATASALIREALVTDGAGVVAMLVA